jgi:dimethylamine corrinoid protein
MSEEDFVALTNAIVAGDRDAALAVVNRLKNSIAPRTLIDKSLAPAMSIVGKKFEQGEFFLSEMLASATVVKILLETIELEKTKESARKPKGTVVIGTVAGDIHDIGKTIVTSMLSGSGYRVIDVGIDVSAETFARVGRTTSSDFVAISALTTTTMLGMRDVIQALEKEGIRRQVKVMVGGAPVTERFAGEIGADLYGKNAYEAVLRANEAMTGMK